MDFKKIIQYSTDCSITTVDRFSYMQVKAYINCIEQRKIVSTVFKHYHFLRSRLIQQLGQRMIASQIKIARAYRAWRCKRLAKLGRFVVTLYWPKRYRVKDTAEVYGSFTNPPWSVFCKMDYNSFFKAYTLTVCMPVSTQFKFVVNGKHKVSDYYPIVYDSRGYQNNEFQVYVSRSRTKSANCLEEGKAFLYNKHLPKVCSSIVHHPKCKYTPRINISGDIKYNDPLKQAVKRGIKNVKSVKSITSANPIFKSITTAISAKNIQIGPQATPQTQLPFSPSVPPLPGSMLGPAMIDPPQKWFFTSAAEVVALHEQTREDFYFMEPCAMGIAEGVVGHQKLPSESNSADQLILNCRQVIKGLITLLYEKQASCGLGKDSRFENSFLLDWDNNSSYLSCGTNKGPEPNSNSFDQPKHDKFVFSGSQDPKDSISHIENRNAAVCIIRAGELFCATSGEAQLLLIRFSDKLPEVVQLPSKGKPEIHSEVGVNPAVDLLKEEAKKELEEDALTYNVKVQDKDLLVLGSANLFTNLSQAAILGAIGEHVDRQGFHELFPQAVAKEIATLFTQALPTSFDVGKNEDVMLIVLRIIDISK